MAVPKRRTGKSRRDRRRAHHKLTPPGAAKCRSCGAIAMPHRVCPACGQYNGRRIIAAKAD